MQHGRHALGINTLSAPRCQLRRTRAQSFGKRATLPNGLEIECISQADVKFLWNEIFEKQAYLQHGMGVAPGDTVLDVGANIGMFSMQAAQLAGPEGKVLAIEPVPATFAALEHNIQAHAAWAERQGLQIAPITCCQTAVGAIRAAEVQLTFYPSASGWSTMYPDEQEVLSAMDVFLEKSLANLNGIEATPWAKVGQVLQKGAPEWLSKRLQRWYIQQMLGSQTCVAAPMTTVSQLLIQHNITKLQLLKIDVERAELEVLHGIAQNDWPKIQQMVLEVHDIKDRLEAVKHLAQETFTTCMVVQDEALKGSTLHNVFCRQ